VYVFELASQQWSQIGDIIKPWELANSDCLGTSVSLVSNYVFAGTHAADRGEEAGCGAIYVYKQQSTNWIPVGKLQGPVVTAGGCFARQMALHGGRLIVSAHGEQSSFEGGAAYVTDVDAFVSSLKADGPFLDDYRSWTASPPTSGGFDIRTAEEGTGSAVLGPTLGTISHLFGACGETNVWVDCYAMLEATGLVYAAAHPSEADLPAWQPCVFAVGMDGQLSAYDGGGTGTWSVVSNVTISAGIFYRYTTKQDYTAKTWELYLNGTNVLEDLGFADSDVCEFSAFSIGGGWGNRLHIDSISITTTEPDFE